MAGRGDWVLGWPIGSMSVIRTTVTFTSLVWWPSCQAARVKKN